MPAFCGLFFRDQETPVCIGLRGGAGRTRTSNQTGIRNLPAGADNAKAQLERMIDWKIEDVQVGRGEIDWDDLPV
jgi:hypothetical protein